MKQAIKPCAEPITRVPCEECSGRGLIKQWIEGKPHTVHMGRCEQCSGFGRVKQ